MSFTKAKVTRFNEIADATPSPAHYNPKGNDRTIGGVIADKGNEKDDNGSVQSTSSSHFRTPSKIKKSKPSTSKSEDSEALKEKNIECDNKDVCIKELLDQLSDLKDQSVNLRSQNDLIERECNDFKLELETINENHSILVHTLKTSFFDDQNILNDQICALHRECGELRQLKTQLLSTFKTEYKKVKKDSQKLTEFFDANIAKYVFKIEAGDNKIVANEKEIVLLKNKLETIKNANKISLDNCNQTYRDNIGVLETKIIEKIKEIEDDDVFNDEQVDFKDEEVQTEDLFDVFELPKPVEIKPIWKRVKKSKNKHLQMYTETYINDLSQKNIKNDNQVIVTSPNGTHMINPKLKMKFYPIKNINEVDIEDKDLKTAGSSSQNTSKDIKKLESLPNIQNKYKKKLKKRENDFKSSKNDEIRALKQTQNVEIDEIKSENEIHLRQIKENYDESLRLGRIQAEEECKVIELAYKVKLEAQHDENEAVLSECEKIGEYSIQESELERDKLKQEVNENKNELIEEQKKKNRFLEYQKLCKDYDSAVNEYKSLEKKLLNVLLKKQLEKNHLKNDHFAYNVTIHKTRETIDALTKRLIESDNDVLQLKNEIKEIEKNNSNFIEKKLKLNEELVALTKENDDLNLQKESTSKLYENDLKDFETNLLKTVETYKESVSKMILDYKIKLETTEYDLQEVIKCLYEQEIVNSEAYNLIHLATNEIEDLEKNNRLFEDKICTLKLELERSKSKINQLVASKQEIEEKLKYEQLQNANLQEEVIMSQSQQEEIESLHKQIAQLHEKKRTYSEYCEYYSAKAKDYEFVINEMNEINRSYIDQTQRYENLVQKCEEIHFKNDELQRIAAEKEILIGPFKQQLENYKIEWQSLIAQKTDAENEARAIGMRYAEVLGHQNQKQKIKHIVDLKEKHFYLLKENETLESKVRNQTKTIEKLKSELAMVGKSPKKKKVIKKVMIVKETESNKENSLHENFASPLRDRNRDE